MSLDTEAIINDFYVDDFLTGANSTKKAITKRDQITTILNSGQFTLSKWSTNHPRLVKNLPQISSLQNIIIDKNAEARIFGLQWNSSEDSFRFANNIKLTPSKSTKRTMLSEIFQLFNPLGLLGPVILIAKLLIQELWQTQIDWDSSIATNIHTRWIQLKAQRESP